jgi:hypothetical protein
MVAVDWGLVRGRYSGRRVSKPGDLDRSCDWESLIRLLYGQEKGSLGSSTMGTAWVARVRHWGTLRKRYSHRSILRMSFIELSQHRNTQLGSVIFSHTSLPQQALSRSLLLSLLIACANATLNPVQQVTPASARVCKPLMKDKAALSILVSSLPRWSSL